MMAANPARDPPTSDKTTARTVSSPAPPPQSQRGPEESDNPTCDTVAANQGRFFADGTLPPPKVHRISTPQRQTAKSIPRTFRKDPSGTPPPLEIPSLGRA